MPKEYFDNVLQKGYMVSNHARSTTTYTLVFYVLLLTSAGTSETRGRSSCNGIVSMFWKQNFNIINSTGSVVLQ